MGHVTCSQSQGHQNCQKKMVVSNTTTNWRGKTTPLKLTAKAPENRPSKKETIVFQPSIFRGKLLVSGTVNQLIINTLGFFFASVKVVHFFRYSLVVVKFETVVFFVGDRFFQGAANDSFIYIYIYIFFFYLFICLFIYLFIYLRKFRLRNFRYTNKIAE